jgi:virulence-associated protein VapD
MPNLVKVDFTKKTQYNAKKTLYNVPVTEQIDRFKKLIKALRLWEIENATRLPSSTRGAGIHEQE